MYANYTMKVNNTVDFLETRLLNNALPLYCLLNQVTQIDKDCDTYNEYICRLCTSQLKPPPLGSRGRVGDLTVTPVKRHQYPYSLRLEFRSNAPTPEARKMKISKLSKKRHVFKRRKFPSLHVQVCSSD